MHSLGHFLLTLSESLSSDSLTLDQAIFTIDEQIKSIFLEKSSKTSEIETLLKSNLGKKEESLIHLYINSFLSTMPQVNNVGDPFENHGAPFARNSKAMMLEILDIFAKKTNFKKNDKKLNFKIGEEPEDYWGYLATRRGSTLLWAAQHAQIVHPQSEMYEIRGLDDFLQKKQNIIRDSKNGKDAIIFLSEKFQIKDIKSLMSGLRECNPESFYIHWTIPLTTSDLQSTLIDIPEEISSLTINTQQMFKSDNYSEILIYRKSKANVKSFFIIYLDQHESTIECSLNGIAAVEVWFLLKYELQKDSVIIAKEPDIVQLIREKIEDLNNENDELIFHNELEKLKRLLILSKIDKDHHLILSLQSDLDDFKFEEFSFYQTFMAGPASFDNSLLFKSFRSFLANFSSLAFDMNNQENSLLNSILQKTINFFAQRHNINNAWGCITSGGSESDEWGILQGRHRYPDSKLFFSESVHYCMEKIAKYYNIPYEKIKVDENDRINLNDLNMKIRENLINPPIIVLTLGTTQKGTLDDLKGVHDLLKDLNITEYYIHLDGALMGVAFPEKSNYLETPFDSICFSTHKLIGCQKVGSILICDNLRNQKKINSLSRRIEGKTLLEIYLIVANEGNSYLEKRKELFCELSKYFQQRLRKYLPKEGDIKVFPDSIYFHFKKNIVKGLWFFGPVGNEYVKACLLPTKKEIIDRFLEDVENYKKY